MLGSTFIFVENPDEFLTFAIDELDRFEHICLDTLQTIDFEQVCSLVTVRWTAGEPILYQEDEGVALFRVTETGLQQVLKSSIWTREQAEDLEKLKAWIDRWGLSDIYELATF